MRISFASLRSRNKDYSFLILVALFLRLLHRAKMIFYSFFKKMYAQLSLQLVLFNHAIGKMGHNPKYYLFNYFMKSWYSGYRASGVKIDKPNRP